MRNMWYVEYIICTITIINDNSNMLKGTMAIKKVVAPANILNMIRKKANTYDLNQHSKHTYKLTIIKGKRYVHI